VPTEKDCSMTKLDAIVAKCDAWDPPRRSGLWGGKNEAKLLSENKDRLVNTDPMLKIRENVQNHLKGLGQKK
jgi:hypothetical protein